MTQTVLITGPMIAAQAEAMLAEHGIACVAMDPATVTRDLAAACARYRADGMIVRFGQVDRHAMEASGRLKVIATHGAGYDHIDVGAATARGLPVLIARAANALSVAEMVLTLALTLLKRVGDFDRSVRSGEWRPAGVSSAELAGKNVGLIGFGATGRETARLLQPFRVNLAAFDRGRAATSSDAPVRLMERIEDLLAWADVVSLHVPLADNTRLLLNRERLGCLKPTAILVNCARGGLVDEAALIDALRAGRLAGAALDTLVSEPCPPDHPLMRTPNLIVTPHVAGVTREALTRMGMVAARNVLSILRGKEFPIENLANPTVLEHPSIKDMFTEINRPMPG